MIITIDGKQCSCEKGEYLLHVARRNGIYIPTLCHHEALPGQGCCRVCIVEVDEGKGPKIVVSCVYPVERECTVSTDSDKVRSQRGIILSLLYKRAPDSELIAQMCTHYGAPPLERLKPVDSGKCILCGLCTRACAELSVGAISTVNRGVTKEVATPYHDESPVCVGCGSCASVCPTDAIPLTETADTRTIWARPLPWCGAPGAARSSARRRSWPWPPKRRARSRKRCVSAAGRPPWPRYWPTPTETNNSTKKPGASCDAPGFLCLMITPGRPGG